MDGFTASAALSFLLIGFTASFLGGLVGLGGGFLIIPALTILLLVPMKEAIIYSLCSLIVLSLAKNIQNRAFIKDNIASLKGFVAMTILGSLGSAYLSTLAPPALLSFIFSIIVFAVGIFYIIDRESEEDQRRAQLSPSQKRSVQLLFLAAGSLAGLLGIGGGTIHVPVMNRILKWKMHEARIASFYFIFIASAIALLVFYFRKREQLVSIPPTPLLILICGTLAGSFLSQRMKISAKNLKRVFGVLLLFVAASKLYTMQI